MGDRVIVVDYDVEWPLLFSEVGRRLRAELGSVAHRIDHIGSTAVPGVAAKPVIDIQVSVESFEPLDRYRIPLERAGFAYRADNPDLTKRYFREGPGVRRTHVHVRRAGSASEQMALLFRDYLRQHEARAQEYGVLKHSLADRFSASADRNDYVNAKEPFIWETIRLAHHWSQQTGWEPPRSDC